MQLSWTALWRDRGLQKPFQLRVGINTGYCTVGDFGSEDRIDYTVVGGEVNFGLTTTITR